MTSWLNWVIAPVVLVSLGVMAAPLDEYNKEIAERIKPVGSVCVEGEDCGQAPAAAADSGEPRSGEQVYNASCMACHSTGAGGAPKLGDGAVWADRVAQGNDTLYQHAIEGVRGMPAMGMCMDCSEDEIKLAVDYIVENSQ